MNRRTWIGLLLGIAVLGAWTQRGIAQAEPDSVQPTQTTEGQPSPDADPSPAKTTEASDADKPSDASPATPDLPTGPIRIGLIPLSEEVNEVMLKSLKRRVAKARADGCNLIVITMDSYGGLVTSALDISDFIKNQGIPIHVWVKPKAISAGSLISLSCDSIVMAPRSKIGDCMPIQIGPEGMQAIDEGVREKIQTVLREEFRDSAKRNGYPVALCEAMIMLGPAIYQIENTKTHEIKYVKSTELAQYDLREDSKDRKGLSGILKINADNDWRLGKCVLEKDRLLTMNQDEAIEYGFAKAIVTNRTELAAHFHTTVDKITEYQTSWSEVLTVFITQPLVRSALFLFFLMGVYMEMKTPGLGIGAIVAISCLVVLLGAPYLTGLAEIWEIVLVFVGVVLIALEIFVIPGFGVAGISGIALVFCGLVLAFVQNEPGHDIIPSLPGTWHQMRIAGLTIIMAMVAGLVMFYFMSKYLGSIPLLNRIVLTESHQRPAEVAAAANTQSQVESTAGRVQLQVGMTATAVSTLRPSGRVEVDGFVIDALTTGGWVEPGREVTILEVQDSRVVVEEA